MNKILKFTEDYPITTGVIMGAILGIPLLFGLWVFFLIELGVIIAADLVYTWRLKVAARRAALIEELRATMRNPRETLRPYHPSDVDLIDDWMTEGWQARGPQGAQAPVSDDE